MSNRFELSKLGNDLIRSYEELRLESYPCAAGVMTIGWGHAVLPHERSKYTKISEAQAESLFKNDIAIVQACMESVISPHLDLNQNQIDSIFTFIFQFGITAFMKSKALTNLNKGNFYGFIVEAFKDTNLMSIKVEIKDKDGKVIRIDRKPLNGLIKRRQDEEALFRSEPFPHKKELNDSNKIRTV